MQNMEKMEGVFEKALLRGDGVLFEHEAYDVFRLCGIDTPSYHFMTKGDDPAGFLKNLSRDKRYVAKIVLNGVTHKTEAGGIVLDVGASDAIAVASDLMARFSNDDNLVGVLFAEQIDYIRDFGSEMIVGLYQDTFFGPTIAFGLGGTKTEYFKEIMKEGKSQAFIPANLTTDTIMSIFDELPAAKILEGQVRGGKKEASRENLMHVVGAFRDLGLSYSQAHAEAKYVIEEIEINPIVASNGKLIALDGVCRVGRKIYDTISRRPVEKIGSLLNPSTIAIAGASGKNPANPSNAILKKFLKASHTNDSVYLIHPKEEEIGGIKCYKDIDAVMEQRGGKPVDCFVVGVPAKIAGAVIADSFEKGLANSVQIISAGFGETKAGREIEVELAKRLKEIPMEKRPVINGPNTLGNIYYNSKSLFTPGYKSSFNGKGKQNAALICQSGAYMITRLSDLAGQVAPQIAISVGNQMDLSVADFLEFLLADDRIDTYGLYIEGLVPGDGKRLMELSRKAREMGKFVIMYKVGRTEAGAEAAKGHTASMAGDYGMFSDLMQRSGAIVVDSPQEFNEMMMLTSLCEGAKNLKKLPGKKIGVAGLSNAGYEKCMISDHLMSFDKGNFEFAKYSTDTQKRLSEVFAKMGIATIVDQIEVLDLSPMTNDEGYDEIIRATLDDDATDFGIYSIVPETGMLNTCEKGESHREDMMREGSILNRLIAIHEGAKKPFVCSMESGWKYENFIQALIDAGVPTFKSADAAARASAKLLNAICS